MKELIGIDHTKTSVASKYVFRRFVYGSFFKIIVRDIKKSLVRVIASTNFLCREIIRK